MIVYFADRQLNIITVASTGLPEGIVLIEDNRVQDIETGVSRLTFKIPYTKDTMKLAEKASTAGNYVLRSDGEDNECYTIIDSELDTGDQTVYVYAEDAGLDMLNKIALIWPTEATPSSQRGPHNLGWFFNLFLTDSSYDGGSAGGGSTGFELGTNEAGTETKTLTWTSEETLTARLLSIAEAFDCEISFSFKIEGLQVTHKYINVYKRRGADKGVKLRAGVEVERIRIKKSIADIATALKCTGAANGGINVNLEGYSYDNGDFYVAPGSLLCSRTARAKWSQSGDIVKTFTYDTIEQSELCSQAIAELTKRREAEVTYEADLAFLPDGVKIGDTVRLIDSDADLYLTTRVMKLEESEYDNKRTATLGDYM